jgi:hypothetical protein
MTTAIVVATSTATTTVARFAAGAEVAEFAREFTFELVFKAHSHRIVGRITALGTRGALFTRGARGAFFTRGALFTRGCFTT